MKADHYRSNCLVILAGNAAFFLFAAQQIVAGALAPPFGVSLVAVPMLAGVGVALSYAALLLPDLFAVYRCKHSNLIVGFAFGLSLGILTALLGTASYKLTVGGFDAAVAGIVEQASDAAP
jgi:hypothetical protein